LSVVSGKEVLARMADWAKATFGVSVTAKRILRQLRIDEISDEVVAVVAAIEDGDPLGAVVGE
jgi:hypothetical protein